MDKTLSNVYREAHAYALDEIATFGLPSRVHFDLSLQKAEEIAKALMCDVALSKIGVVLMDLKLGESFKKGELAKHVQRSAECARDFLEKFELSDEEHSTILNSIEAHHKGVPFNSLESEVCANADCYRFIHPLGVVYYLTTLGKRDLTPLQILDTAESKLDEKHGILSLEYCKREIGEYYQTWKKIFTEARKAIK